MITVTVLTKNSQKYLVRVLEALHEFNEVLIYDNGSADNTLAIARQFPNVRIITGPFLGFGLTHNEASQSAKNDWILSIDSDEIVTPEMAKEIQQLALDPQAVYSFPRENIFNGRVIYWCGWYPDRQYRLYHRKHTKFTDAQVHEQIIIEGMKVIELNSPIRHHSYDSMSDFLTKMQMYSDLFAQQNTGKRQASLWTALGHSTFTFLKSYFLKKGFMGGFEGFVISSYNAQTAFYKYLKLREANAKKEQKLL